MRARVGNAITELAVPAVKQPARRRGLARRLFRVARIGALVYLLLCLMISLLQETLIFPGATTQGQKHAIVRPAPNEELVNLNTADGVTIVGLFGSALTPEGLPEASAANRPTLLFFYGNGMCLADTAGEFRKFRRLGVNIFIPEYVVYGMSGGKPSEQGVYATAEAAYAHLLNRTDIDKTKIVPVGWSLGAGAAIEITSKHPTPALVTLSAFTSMSDMARKLLPVFPASLMLKHHFENEQKLRTITCPVLIIHGKRDSVIPFSMSKRLEAAAQGKAARIAIEDADHNDLFEIGGEQLFNAILQFLNANNL